MASGGQATRLCLVLTAEAGSATAERLSAALQAADISSVILRAGSGGYDAGALQPLIATIQKAGAAALIENDARMARTLKSDGVHLAAAANVEETYAEAREIVGGGAIVGMDAGTLRHDAMSLGEAGADYIAFGVPAGADEAAREERLDRVGWWAEIFEPPCVALEVATPEEAGALAAAGADFVAVPLPPGCSLADARDLVAAFAAAIAHGETVG